MAIYNRTNGTKNKKPKIKGKKAPKKPVIKVPGTQDKPPKSKKKKRGRSA